MARNGAEAVQAVQWYDNQGLAMFDIVLMDCNMPVLDGFGAARAIRTWERERGVTRARTLTLTLTLTLALTLTLTLTLTPTRTRARRDARARAHHGGDRLRLTQPEPEPLPEPNPSPNPNQVTAYAMSGDRDKCFEAGMD